MVKKILDWLRDFLASKLGQWEAAGLSRKNGPPFDLLDGQIKIPGPSRDSTFHAMDLISRNPVRHQSESQFLSALQRIAAIISHAQARDFGGSDSCTVFTNHALFCWHPAVTLDGQ
jgi:hypothetical protein